MSLLSPSPDEWVICGGVETRSIQSELHKVIDLIVTEHTKPSFASTTLMSEMASAMSARVGNRQRVSVTENEILAR